MPVDQQLRFASLDDLSLDPRNPRLGRNNTGPNVKQSKVLEAMADWKLDELAVSFLENGGFWVQEALIAVKEKLYGEDHLVVVEGNRRLAALIKLKEALKGKDLDKKWSEIVKDAKPNSNLFKKIPYLLADSRKDVEAFLGFRHVTGIEQWRPAEKAEYIAKLVDGGATYQEVRRKIGTHANTVRQNYISYKLLLEVEKHADIPGKNFEDRFSVMYLSLRTEGVQKYLHIDVVAEPQAVRRELPKVHKKALVNFALWMFGDEQKPPLFTDSREVDNFGRILENKDAVAYLESSDKPSFEVALRTAGGDEPEIIEYVDNASNNIELALTRAHHYPKSKKLQASVERLLRDCHQVGELFPGVRDKVAAELKNA
jgi:transposase-like protein